MYETAVALVICSGLLHAVWNMLAKRSRNVNVYLMVINLASSVVLLPFVIPEWLHTSLSTDRWGLIAASFCLQGVYALLMTRAYKFGDLSQVYPIMRGTPVIFVPLIGVLFLGEQLSGWGWCGIALIAAGISAMNIKRSKAPSEGKAVLSAVLIGVTITTYSLVDKLLLDDLSPLAVLQFTNLGFALALLPSLRHTKGWLRELKSDAAVLAAGCIVSPGSYFLYLVALSMAPISHLAPLRECGTVFGAILGVFLLKERYPVRRLTAAAVITAGILTISFNGL